MSKPTLLITGAENHIGQELIKSLPRNDFKVIAGVHPNDKIPGLAEHCDSVISFDSDIASSVADAFGESIDYLFLIPSKSEERALQAKRLISVAIERNIKFIVLISLLDCHVRTGILAAQFRYMEQYELFNL